MENRVKELYSHFENADIHKCKFSYNPKNCNEHVVRWSDKNKLELPIKGIYFLMIDNFVVYVGMSISGIKTRIFGDVHNARNGYHFDTKVFNSFKTINLDYLDKESIMEIESIYINMLNTHYNSIGNHQKFLHFVPQNYWTQLISGRNKFDKFLELQADETYDIMSKFLSKAGIN